MPSTPTEPMVDPSEEQTKPPFLRRVRIRGYKSIVFCDVGLQPLTILVGQRGREKQLPGRLGVFARCP